MLRPILLLLVCLLAGPGSSPGFAASSRPVLVDHRCTQLSLIPESAIQGAKNTLHIAYGHTSHGSQLTTGMTGLVAFKGQLYAWNAGGTGGSLDLRDTPFSGASDLGNPDRSAWEAATRAYLAAHPEINVILWSWCGQVSTATEADIDLYLRLMTGLENDYPQVTFVYMTGHLDGSGLTGNLHLRNEQIRNYCRAHRKVLYDFADIESYDPDNRYFGDKLANDACDYDSDNNGTRDRNWAQDWQASHALGTDWYDCPSAHSEALNANRKAYAAWWLWAQLAGWQGAGTAPPAPALTVVFPNPANARVVFEVRSEHYDHVRIALMNTAGECVLRAGGELLPPGVRITADTSGLAPGLYFYQVSGSGGKAGSGKLCIRR